MAFFVTGRYTDKDGSGYYVFNSDMRKASKVSNEYLKENPDIVKHFNNAALKRNAVGPIILEAKGVKGGITSVYSPASTINGAIEKETRTLVYIDLNRLKYGLVNYDGSEIIWEELRELPDLPLRRVINNLQYIKNTGRLELEAYHIIGKVPNGHIILKNYIERPEKKVNKSKKAAERLSNEASDTGSKAEEESKKHVEIQRDDSNTKQETKKDEGNKELRIRKELDINKEVTLKSLEYYKSILGMMEDEDIITIPKDVLSNIDFRTKENLETNMDVSRRVYIGELNVGKPETYTLAIIKAEDSSNKAKVQIIKGKTVDKAIAEYSRWRANHRFLKL